jgi:hypothetical protein
MNWLKTFGGIDNLWLKHFLSLVITNKAIFDCIYIHTRTLRWNRRPKFRLRAGQIAARQERRDGRFPAEQPSSHVTIDLTIGPHATIRTPLCPSIHLRIL